MSIEIALLITIIMLLGNAFFVGAEFGLISARRSSIEPKAANGSRSAKITLHAMEHVSLMLAGAQLGVTLCSLVLGAVGEPLFAHLLEPILHALNAPESMTHPISFIFAISTMVYLHVVIGEMVPKNLALANPDKTALLLTPLLVFLVRITRPVVVGLNALANSFLRLVGVAPQKEIPSTFTRDEVSGFIEESKREGLISKDEGELLTGAMSFHERTIKSVVLPLKGLVIAPYKSTPETIELLAAKTGYSRFPIYDANKNPSSYVHIKDILQISQSNHSNPIPTESLRPLISVSVRTTLKTALAMMQNSGSHLAKVTDKNHKIIGIIALEDLVEEIVGEIRDETKKL